MGTGGLHPFAGQRTGEQVSGRSATQRPARVVRHCLAVLALTAAGVAAQADAGTLADVLKRKALVVCAQADALPYSREGGDPEGFQVDLARALAADLDVALQMRFTRLHREPRRGECDALITVAVPRDAGRGSDYRMTNPYMMYRSLLVVRESRPEVAALEGFAPGRIAVQSGSWAHYLLTERGIPVWVRFRSDDDMMDAVESGKAEAAIVSNIGYGWYRQRHPDSPVRAASAPALDEDLGFDVAVGLMDADVALLDRINDALSRLSEAGVVDATLARYGITRLRPSSADR